jgi:hypothetical protein
VLRAKEMFSPCAEYRRKPRLFGKFFPQAPSGGILGELFIKLQFILRQRLNLMVNQASLPAVADGGERHAP